MGRFTYLNASGQSGVAAGGENIDRTGEGEAGQSGKHRRT